MTQSLESSLIHYGRAMAKAMTTGDRKMGTETEREGEDAKVTKSAVTGYKHVGSSLGHCCRNFKGPSESMEFYIRNQTIQ